MAKVLGFTIEIQGTKTAIDTTNQLKEALKKINEEMGKTSDKALFETMQKEAAKLKAELNGINKEQQNFVRQMEAAKTGKGSYVELNAELVKLRQNYKAMSAEERASPIGKETIKSIGQLDKELKKIDASMGQFQRNVGNYPQTILGALGQLVPGFGRISSVIGDVGSQATKTGKLITGAFGIIGLIVAAGQELYAANVKIDEGLADVQKTSGLAKEQVRQLSEELKTLDTRTSLEDLLKIGAALGQLGVAVNKDTIGAIDKLNVALGGELAQSSEEVATKIGILRNLLTDTQTANVADDYLKLGNALNVAGATGAATADVMQDIASRIASTGRSLGLTSGQILGLSKSLQESGLNAEKAGTGMNRILTEIAKAPEKFAQTLKLPVAEFKKLTEEDLAAAFIQVVKRVDELKKSGGDAIKMLDTLKITGEGERAVFLNLASTIDQTKGNIDLMTQSLKETTSISAENAAKQETLGATWEKLSNRIQNSWISQGLTGLLKGIAISVDTLIQAFGTFGEGLGLVDNKIEKQNKALAAQKSEFNSLVNVLKDTNLNERTRAGIIDQLQSKYPDYIKNINLQNASESDLNALILSGNKLMENRVGIAQRTEYIEKLRKQVDVAKEMELSAAKSVQFEIDRNNKKGEEASRDRMKRATENIEKNLKEIARVEEEINIMSGVKEAKAKQDADAKAKADADKLQANLDDAKSKRDKRIAEQKKKEDDARSASLKAEEEFYKAIERLRQEYAQLTVSLIEDRYEKERQAIQNTYVKRVEDLSKAEADLRNKQAEELNKAVAAYGANSKQVVSIKQRQAFELAEFDKQRAANDIKFLEDKAKAEADLENKIKEENKQSRKKALDERIKAIEDFYKKEADLVNRNADTRIAELMALSQDEQDAMEGNEKGKLQVREKYADLIYEAEKKRIQDEIALLKGQSYAKSLNGISTESEDAEIAALLLRLEKLNKTRKKSAEKGNKEIAEIDKKDNDEKVKRAQEALGLIQDFASQVASFIDELNQRQLDKMDEQINKHKDLISSLEDQMSNTTGAQRVELQRQIDQEKAALEQSTINKKNAEKEAAKEHQRIALIQTIINTAMAVMNAYASPPFGLAKAIMAGVAGAIQTGIIASQAFAQGGKVLSGEKIRSRPNIRMRNGDNVLATVRTGEVILNERQQAMLGGSRTFKRIGVPGFADGGFTGAPLPRPADYFMDAQTAGMPTNNEFKALIRSIDARFDRMQVTVVGEDVQNELNNQARAKKAAVI